MREFESQSIGAPYAMVYAVVIRGARIRFAVFRLDPALMRPIWFGTIDLSTIKCMFHMPNRLHCGGISLPIMERVSFSLLKMIHSGRIGRIQIPNRPGEKVWLLLIKTVAFELYLLDTY
jgi:hypothetical protein